MDSARFAPDGQTIVYSAAFGGDPVEIYTTRPDSPQSRELGLKGSSLLGVSSTDELAVSLEHRFFTANASDGTLARLPLSGGAPRELAENIICADWSPDGTAMAAVRTTDGPTRLEYPLGKMLYETNGWISDARVSPDGDKVAFIDHPIIFDSRGSIMVVDRAGQRRTLATGFGDVLGLSWHPSGQEIWFTGSREHLSSNLLAVNLSGKQRLVWAGAGEVILQGKPSRSYLQDADGGPLTPVTPERMNGRLSPNGKSVLVRRIRLSNAISPGWRTAAEDKIPVFRWCPFLGPRCTLCLRRTSR